MTQKFFEDNNGKITLWQTPNLALVGWAMLSVINHFVSSQALSWLASAILFAWALMELLTGVNWFRRLLGLTVLILIIVKHL
ncbi:MAG TPA: hypothetical protein VLE72_03940 [Candidatus Saccharimonadales bacterium]|nr:hypothetical protein [Candidatus Saccharimonadales bacterium]